MNLDQLNEAIEAKKRVIDNIFAESGPDLDMKKVKSLTGDATEKTIAIKRLTDEFAALVKERAGLLKLAKERRDADAAVGYTGLTPRGDPMNYNHDAVGSHKGGPAVSKKYRAMFPGASHDSGGFNSFEEYLKVVDSGRYDVRLKTMTEGSSSGGGFMVPIEYAAQLLDASLEAEIVRPRATVWPMHSDLLRIPAWDSADHSSNLFGGFAGVWLAENSTATRQTPKLRQLELKTKKLAIYTQASREMVQDGIAFESQLTDALVKSLGWYLDYAFLQGSGVGEPLGVLNDPALVVVAKEESQPADTIKYANCIKMFAQLHPSCLANAVWIANTTCIPQLMAMAVETVITDEGTVNYIPALLQTAGQFTLLTRPVIFTEKLPAVGDQGDLLLVDLGKYAIGMRQELALDKSNAPGWTEDTQDYRAILRCDGMGTWDKAITPKHGDSLSWCVTLAERDS